MEADHTDRPQGQIVTFYSFKGGVGRSMALANVALLVARAGKRVLCVDWDLEAPGLDRYFGPFDGASGATLSAPEFNGGLLALLDGSGERACEWTRFVQTRTEKGSTLDFLPSGDASIDYSMRLAGFSWETFYRAGGGDVVEYLRNQWRAAYDFVFIDARTGLSDSSGICTIQLPDVVALLFAANDQNLSWCFRIAAAIREGRKSLAQDRTFLPIVPVLSRFDDREESELAARALKRAASLFAPLFGDWLPQSIRPIDMLAWSALPYFPRYSFEEALAVDEEVTGGPGLAYRYNLLSQILISRFRNLRAVLGTFGVPGAVPPNVIPEPKVLRDELSRDFKTFGGYMVAIEERASTDPALGIADLEALAQGCMEAGWWHEAEIAKRRAIEIALDPATADSLAAANCIVDLVGLLKLQAKYWEADDAILGFSKRLGDVIDGRLDGVDVPSWADWGEFTGNDNLARSVESAMVHLSNCQQLASAGPSREVAFAQSALALATFSDGGDEASLEAQQQALAMFRRLDDGSERSKLDLATSLALLADIAQYTAEDITLEAEAESISLWREIAGSRPDLGAVPLLAMLLRHSINQRFSGDATEALASALEAGRLASDLKLLDAQRAAIERSAQAYAVAGQIEEAVGAGRRLVELDRVSGSRRDLANSLESLAKFLFAAEDRTSAAESQLESVQISRELATNNPSDRRRLATRLSTFASLVGDDIPMAAAALREALLIRLESTRASSSAWKTIVSEANRLAHYASALHLDTSADALRKILLEDARSAQSELTSFLRDMTL